MPLLRYPKAVESLLLGLLVLNILDATLTVWVLREGLAFEANPLIRYVFEQGGVVGFVAIKTTLVAGGTFLLWSYQHKLLAALGAYLCFAVYWALAMWFWVSTWGP